VFSQTMTDRTTPTLLPTCTTPMARSNNNSAHRPVLDPGPGRGLDQDLEDSVRADRDRSRTRGRCSSITSSELDRQPQRDGGGIDVSSGSEIERFRRYEMYSYNEVIWRSKRCERAEESGRG
jgi:hypothetical protein